ncbi:MAG: STAS domain-containing protein, partial [Candidatus Sulfotelmatobacter sp.]
MPITFDQSEGLSSIRLEGEVDITYAAELKKLLLRALASGVEVRLELEQAKEMDVTALQLLWAAERQARSSGLRFTVAGRIPGEMSATLQDAGFEKFP